jgi:hypothetical protein
LSPPPESTLVFNHCPWCFRLQLPHYSLKLIPHLTITAPFSLFPCLLLSHDTTMPRVIVRQNCPANTAFYRCAVGPFTGCCSTNPCDTGVCGDSNSGSGSGSSSSALAGQSSSAASDAPNSSKLTQLTLTASNTASTSVSSSSSTIATTSHAKSTYSSSTDPSSKHSSSASSTYTPSPVSISPSSSNSPHHSKIPAIGGIVGGLALAALLALLLYYCCRRKKNGGFKLSLNRNKVVEQRNQRDDQARDFIVTAAGVAAASESRHAANQDIGGSSKPRNAFNSYKQPKNFF